MLHSIPLGILSFSSGGFPVENSCMFEDGNPDRLTREYSTTRSSARLFTISFWIKRGNLGLVQNIICQNDSNQNALTVQIQSDDTFNVLVEDSGGSAIMQRRTTAVYRDPHAWYHFHIKIDSGQTDDTSCRVYVNGVEETVFGTKTNPGSAQDTRILLSGGTNQLHIGTGKNGSDSPLDAYLAEVLILDGQSVVADSNTGEYDTNGVWRPVKVSGSTFGNNGFYLEFGSSGASIGNDTSGNSQNFTRDNTPTQTTDTCTDNHATFSPLLSNASKVTLSEGNMRAASSTSSGHVGLIVSGFELPTAGKYYWEWVVNTVGTTPALGWRSVENLNPNGHSSAGNNQADFITGNDYNTGSGRILSSEIDGSTSLSQAAYGNFLTVSGGNPLANGSVLGCAYDADNGLAWFSFNDSWVDGNGTDNSATVKGEIEAGTSGSQAFTTANGAVGEAGLHIIARSNSVSSFNYTLRTRSDQWTGTCPTGFTAVSTKNQAEAVTFAIEDGSAYHQTRTYAGDNGTRTVAQDGNSTFTADWVWVKDRNFGNAHSIWDSVRGANLFLKTPSNVAENTEANVKTSGDGFSDANGLNFTGAGASYDINASGRNYVAWQWLAGGAPTADNTAGAGATPTSGSVKIDGSNLGSSLSGSLPAKRLSANTKAGFSIVKWTGNGGSGGAQTVAHGLGQKPNMIFVKNLDDSENWVVYHDDVGFNALPINTSLRRITTGASVYWNDSAHNETIFNVNTHNGVNGDGDEMIAYCFAAIPGYSAIGKYVGNGSSTNGPFVNTGFSPSWILARAYDDTSDAAEGAIHDSVRDPINPMDNELSFNRDGTEDNNQSAPQGDFLSNGFKIGYGVGTTGGGMNISGVNYIYLAFAENPFAGTTPATAR